MLMKLWKSDVKAIGRILWPLYGCFMAVGLLIGYRFKSTIDSLEYSINIPEGNNAGNLLGNLFMLLFLASMITTMILLVQRFQRSMFKKEGYFTFSLPMNISTILFEKVLVILFWVLINLLVFFTTFYLMFSGTFSFNEINLQLQSVYVQTEGLPIKIFTVILLYQMMMYLQICFSMTVAYQFSNYRVLIGVLVWFGLCFLLPSLNPNNVLTTNYTYAYPLIVIAILFTGMWALLKYRLNLD